MQSYVVSLVALIEIYSSGLGISWPKLSNALEVYKFAGYKLPPTRCVNFKRKVNSYFMRMNHPSLFTFDLVFYFNDETF